MGDYGNRSPESAGTSPKVETLKIHSFIVKSIVEICVLFATPAQGFSMIVDPHNRVSM